MLWESGTRWHGIMNLCHSGATLCHSYWLVFAFKKSVTSKRASSSTKTSFISLEILIWSQDYQKNLNIWTQHEFCFSYWLYCYQNRSRNGPHKIGCLATMPTSLTVIYFMHFFKEVSY